MATLADALQGMISPEALDDLVTAVARLNLSNGYQTLAAAGAVSLDTVLTEIDITGATAYTLADGTFLGQRKSIIMTVNAGGTDAGTLTPATFASGSSITLNAVGEQIELEWQADGWHTVHVAGATVNA